MLVLVGLLLRMLARSRVVESGVLLPTALARLQSSAPGGVAPSEVDTTPGVPSANPFVAPPPASIWWVSLIWLERGIYGAGASIARAGMRIRQPTWAARRPLFPAPGALTNLADTSRDHPVTSW